MADYNENFNVTLQEDIGDVTYTVTRHMGGYRVTAYQRQAGNTLSYHGKGDIWWRLSRNAPKSLITDGRVIVRLADITAEFEREGVSS